MIKNFKKSTVLATITGVVILAAYLLAMFVQPGLISYLASFLPLIVLAVTAIARVNDIGKDKVETRWHVRRMGLSVVAGASVIALLGPAVGLYAFPTWETVGMYWGFALTWLTTPEMPPWWKWISGNEPAITGD